MRINLDNCEIDIHDTSKIGKALNNEMDKRHLIDGFIKSRKHIGSESIDLIIKIHQSVLDTKEFKENNMKQEQIDFFNNLENIIIEYFKKD